MIDLVVAAVYTRLAAAGLTWAVYSGTVPATVRPPYLRIGECSEVPNSVMGSYGADVVVPVHGYAEGGSVIALAAKLSAVRVALEAAGAVAITGRTVTVLHEGTDDVGPEIGSGAVVQHFEGRYRLWIR